MKKFKLWQMTILIQIDIFYLSAFYELRLCKILDI